VEGQAGGGGVCGPAAPPGRAQARPGQALPAKRRPRLFALRPFALYTILKFY